MTTTKNSFSKKYYFRILEQIVSRLLIFLFLLFNCSFVFSQITTDRPDQTESAVVLPTGQIQIESGISIEDSQSNINTLFRIGIIEGIEIRLNSNYLINDELSFMKKSSFSDFEVGAKFKIFNKTFICNICKT